MRRTYIRSYIKHTYIRHWNATSSYWGRLKTLKSVRITSSILPTWQYLLVYTKFSNLLGVRTRNHPNSPYLLLQCHGTSSYCVYEKKKMDRSCSFWRWRRKYCTSTAAVVFVNNCDLFLPFPSTLRFKRYKKCAVQKVREQYFCQSLETDRLLLQKGGSPDGERSRETAARLRIAEAVTEVAAGPPHLCFAFVLCLYN
jgi:hypothetical protein